MPDLIVRAHYDGEVVRPETPVNLVPDTVYALTITKPSRPREPGESIWDILDRHRGSFEGPGNLSTNLDHYLYGTPKREDEQS